MRAAIPSAVLAFALLLTPAATATVIYVDPDSPTDGPGNGERRGVAPLLLRALPASSLRSTAGSELWRGGGASSMPWLRSDGFAPS